MVDKIFEEAERRTLWEDDSNEPPPADIIAYNELRSCADLFRMSNQGILDIQPDFQRDVVWNGADQTRFIDSLVKQLPIPSMCFSLDYKTQKWLVIDGLQRLSTIIKFLKGADWKLSDLDDITADLSGKSAAAIKDKNSPLHQYYSRVENLTIPITVLRCDYSKKNHMEYLFTIFHRLNSGGMKLNNQEIRNCIYGGVFNTLLKSLDSNVSWRRINRMKKGENYRLTKQELILRFFAFSARHKQYKGSLSKFLNSYMQENRDISPQEADEKKNYFDETVVCIDEKIFGKKQPARLSITIIEALLFGIGMNLEKVRLEEADVLQKKFQDLVSHEDFSETLIREGLSKRQRVIDRLDTAVSIFAS